MSVPIAWAMGLISHAPIDHIKFPSFELPGVQCQHRQTIDAVVHCGQKPSARDGGGLRDQVDVTSLSVFRLHHLRQAHTSA
jgi:hypothetical protein